MFEALSRLFQKSEADTAIHDPRLAVAALLVHLAAVDGQMKDEERQAIKSALRTSYALDDIAVEKLIRDAALRDAESVDFYKFTSALSSLESQERIEVVRMMWQVVFADKQNHELEDNMVWRVAELIGVSARDRTTLRHQIGKAAKPEATTP